MTSLATLPDVTDVARLSESDASCLAELREVLTRHGNLTRFGLTLLHQHFELADDEILVETCDEERRVLTSRPMKRSEIEGRSVLDTSWRLDTQDALAKCVETCVGPSTLSCDRREHVSTDRG